jgi:hypothetical protein
MVATIFDILSERRTAVPPFAALARHLCGEGTMPTKRSTLTSRVQFRSISDNSSRKAGIGKEACAARGSDGPAARVRYKDIAGFPGYRVGTDGSVWSCWNRGGGLRGNRGGGLREVTSFWRLLTPDHSSRHKRVRLVKDGQGHTQLVHRLVLAAFVGPCPPGMEARHFPDRDTRNNSLVNLSWGTHSQNCADTIVHGTMVRGERNGNAKLTEFEVRKVRRLAASGWSQRQIARRFGVSQSTVQRIAGREIWSWLPDDSDGNTAPPGQLKAKAF